MSEAENLRLQEQIRAATDLRAKERLQVAHWATSGQHTLADLARLAGRARSTIQEWLAAFAAGGVDPLLERQAPPGKSSPVAGDKVQAQRQAGRQAGPWRTAGQLAAWLKEKHGIERAAKSMYYWLGKVGGARRVPRPCHGKQDPAAVATFRAELEQNLEKLELPKDRPVKIWVADEARFGWHTQSRRGWALRGERVVRAQEQRYEWEYVSGAVEVVTGAVAFQSLPSVSLELSRGFRRQLAASDPQAEPVVICDQARVSSPRRRSPTAGAAAPAAAAARQPGTQPRGRAVGSSARRDLQPPRQGSGSIGVRVDVGVAPVLGDARPRLGAHAPLAPLPTKRHSLTHITDC